jgi:aspartyl-tRNA(Asn)/glutamyl-tRNA(Gln) amidotransferase subunit C
MDLKELKETAGLAHLNMGDDELAAALPAFEQMLTFFAIMQNSPANGQDGKAADGQAAGARLVRADHFRSDAAPADLNGVSSGMNENILNNAGGRDGRFIVIPNVL